MRDTFADDPLATDDELERKNRKSLLSQMQGPTSPSPSPGGWSTNSADTPLPDSPMGGGGPLPPSPGPTQPVPMKPDPATTMPTGGGTFVPDYPGQTLEEWTRTHGTAGPQTGGVAYAPPPVTSTPYVPPGPPGPAEATRSGAPGGFGSYQWQQTPEGQQFYNRLKTYFPAMSDADLASALNFDRMPDARYQQAIITNLAQHGGPQQQQPAAAPQTQTAPTGPTGTGNFQQDFWTAVQGIPVSRGNLGPVAEKLKGMGYSDARVTGEDTIFANGQEWDIVPAGDGSWQLIPDAGGSGGGGGAGAPNLNGGMDPEMAAAFRSQLLQLMNGGTRNPGIDQVQNAYRNERTRGAQQERGALAERAAFEGLNSGGQGSGAFDTGIQGINEQASQDIAGNAAKTEYEDYQQRRQQLMQSLELAQAMGATSEAHQIQLYLSQLDNQFRYASLGENSRQFDDDLALRYEQHLADLNRQALLAGMG